MAEQLASEADAVRIGGKGTATTSGSYTKMLTIGKVDDFGCKTSEYDINSLNKLCTVSSLSKKKGIIDEPILQLFEDIWFSPTGSITTRNGKYSCTINSAMSVNFNEPTTDGSIGTGSGVGVPLEGEFTIQYRVAAGYMYKTSPSFAYTSMIGKFSNGYIPNEPTTIVPNTDMPINGIFFQIENVTYNGKRYTSSFTFVVNGQDFRIIIDTTKTYKVKLR